MEVGDIVICSVERINKTMVSVRLDSGEEASIIMSEIAPGRIRNIRDYVKEGKVIICKILRIQGGRIDLSLRRVSEKDRKEKREEMALEKSSKGILKGIVGPEKAPEVVEKILNLGVKVSEFLEESKEDSSKLEEFVGKEFSEKIMEIVNSQKIKTAIIKKIFNFSTNDPNGIEIIKNALGKVEGVDIKYISAGKYSISAESEDKKTADNKIMAVLNDLVSRSKKEGFEISFKER